MCFSPDGTRIAAARFADTIYLWDAQTGDEIPTPSGLGTSVRGVAFSPDGNRLAILDEDFTVKVWDMNLENRDPATELRRLAEEAPGCGS